MSVLFYGIYHQDVNSAVWFTVIFSDIQQLWSILTMIANHMIIGINDIDSQLIGWKDNGRYDI